MDTEGIHMSHEEQFERTRLLLGESALEKLHNARVAIFGIGGVGGYVAEADINPMARVEPRCCFYLPENADEFDFSSYSYVVDAVDTVTAKLEIIQRAKKSGVPVISSMGAGNKTDPTRFRVDDIYQTSICPLARVMRRECRKRGIRDLKVVYSTEEPVLPMEELRDDSGKKVIPGSMAYVPSAAGLVLASEVVRDLII